MDLNNNNNNYKRGYSDGVQEVEEDDDSHPKRTCPSLPTGVEAEYDIIAQAFSAEIWPKLELVVRRMVCEEIEKIQPKLSRFLQPSSPKNRQMNETGEGAISGSGTLKLKLCFLDQIPSPIYTNNDIKAKNGEPLRVAICDATDFDAVVWRGPLSSAQVEFFVLNGEFSSNQRQKESQWTVSDFNRSVLSQRDGKRPLLIGNDLKLYLKDGVGLIESLSITDNSRWMKSGMFRLGAKIIDEKILATYPRVREAVSEPFKVMDHRGEVYKKHHPPSREDKVWRLEGIHRDGTYHKNLSSQGINTVGDFLKAYEEKGALPLKKLVGNRVPNKTWNAMVGNAFEIYQSFELQDLVEINEANGDEALEGNLAMSQQNNWDDSCRGFFEDIMGDEALEGNFDSIYDQIQEIVGDEAKISGVVGDEPMFYNFEAYSPLAGEASTTCSGKCKSTLI